MARYVYSDGEGSRQNGVGQLATRLGANQDTSLPFSGSNVPEVIELLDASGAVTQILMLSINQVGSVQLVADAATGEVVQRIEYDEFGRILSDSAPGMQPFGFAGGLYDSATNLVRFGARDYASDVGRWVARDAVREKGGSNSFTYLFDDPINGNDPLGFASDVSWFFSLWNFAKELLGIKSGMDCNEAQRDLDRARKRCDDQNAACWGPNSSMEACQEKCEETGMNPTSPSSDRMKCLMKTPEWKKWGNSCGPSVLDFL